MALTILVFCVFAAWFLSTFVIVVPYLLGFLVPSHWLTLGILLVLVTWLMRD